MPAPPAMSRDEDIASEYYLQDPHLWRDQLPQPFRMIDNLLNDLYSRAWVRIERREIERQQVAARVKVPELTDVKLVEGVQGVVDVCGGRDGLMFVGGSAGLSVLRGGGEEGNAMEKVAHCDTTTEAKSIAVGWNNDVHFIVTLHDREVKIFGLISSHLVFLCDVLNLSDQDEDSSSPSHISISQCSSHVTITMTHSQNGTQLDIYRLPLDNWHNELNQFMERQRVASAEDTTESQEEQQDIVYSKVSHLYTLSPPSPLTPCTAPNPASALQSVVDGRRDHIPTGEHHILSQCFFERRRKAFVSQRAHFVTKERDTKTYQHNKPTCHYLYYKNACREATPCYLAVWWQHHTQLLTYPLTDSNKGPPSPHRLYPQSNAIVQTSVNKDSSRMAIGLLSGAITIWDLVTNLCLRVLSTGVCSDGSVISAMLFFNGGMQLGVGMSGGKVMVVPTLKGSELIAHLNQRIDKQREAHGILFSSSPYDTKSEVIELKVVPGISSVVASLHSDGALTMWSSREREALCTLPKTCVVHNGLCSFTSDRGYALLIAQHKESEREISTSLLSINLHSVPTLTPQTVTPSHPPNDDKNTTGTGQTMMSTVEALLAQYTRSRCLAGKENPKNIGIELLTHVA